MGCENLTKATLGEGLKKISNGVFQDCSKLESIVFPENLEVIGTSAFYGCSTLTSVAIPNSVTTLDFHAFRYCKGLKTVVIGRGQKSGAIGYSTSSYFGNWVFADCENLKDVYSFMEISVPTYEQIFENSYIQYATLHVVHPMIEDYKAQKAWNEFGTIVSLTPEELKLDLDKCQKIISFADPVVKEKLVSYYDYDGDGELSEGEAEYVNDDVFAKCSFAGNKNITSFDEFKYFTGLPLIRAEKFSDCSKLTSITIPEGVTLIAYDAFSNCI